MSEEVERYTIGYDPELDSLYMKKADNGEYVKYKLHRDLLAKYNYLLEWSHKQGDLGYRDLDFYKRAFERAYKESLK